MTNTLGKQEKIGRKPCGRLECTGTAGPKNQYILTLTQYPAIVGITEQINPFVYAGFANPSNAQQPLTAHS